MMNIAKWDRSHIFVPCLWSFWLYAMIKINLDIFSNNKNNNNITNNNNPKYCPMPILPTPTITL